MRYPLELVLRPSVRLQTLMFAMHGIAASAFLLSALPRVVVAAALALTAASLLAAWRSLRAQDGWLLRLGEDGLLELGARGPARVLPNTTDFAWAIWLCWEEGDGRRHARMFAPDALPPGGWRLLRIWLRHKVGQAGAPPVTPAGG